MNKLLLSLSFVSVTFAVSAQALDENFESSQGIPDGWTTRSAEGTESVYKWSISEYSNDAALKSLTGFTSGGNNAISSTTGRNSPAAPDSWLISPKISIADGDVLNFMMGCLCSYNEAATEANRTKFEVVVSETGTEAADFTTAIYSITPSGLKNWSNYSIDLSRFAGKQVYIAFHDYGTTARFPFSTNKIYLDNIAVNKVKSSDLSVSAIINPVPSCETEQQVSVTVGNAGFAASSFSVNYQIDGGSVVTEQVQQAIEDGGTFDYTFKQKVVLQQGLTHTVKAWVSSDNDLNEGNNSIEKEVAIGGEMEYPFTMTDDNAQTAFHSSASRQLGNITYGWAYYNDSSAKGWGYSYQRNFTSYLLTNCIALPKGSVKVNFNYMTLIDADLRVYLVSENGKYDTEVGSVVLPVSENYTSGDMTLEIPEEGVYSLAFTPNNYQGQLFLNDIQIRDPYDDVAIASIDSPRLNATLVKSGVSVTASFKNTGAKDLTDVPVAFSVDGGAAVTEKIAKLAKGETVQHTFNSTVDLSKAGSHNIKVWAALESDGNNANDEKTFAISSYNAYSFPFKASFEPGETVGADWICYNPDADLVFWGVDQTVNGNISYAKDGQNAGYINSLAGVQHNDYFISPAIKATAGKARISFYYTTRMQSASTVDGSNIKVFLSKTDNPDEIKLDSPLTTVTLTNANVLKYTQGYALVDVPEDGNYYIVFYNDGTGHDVILDDVRFDRADDLCMLSVENSLQSGFNLADNTVTVRFTNHGLNTRSNFPVQYVVNDGEPVVETFAESIAPGETKEYVFSKKADFSKSGTYVVKASVSDSDDSDSYNNSWTSAEVKHYETAAVPYEEDFEDADKRVLWTVNGKWTIGTNMASAGIAAYSGKCGLNHMNAASSDGDFIYSGGIYIPAGTYDLSFFYRTFMNQTNAEKYGQSFEVLLGKAPESDAMTIPVYKAENVIVSTKQYEKVIAPVTIEESGVYYIGVKCTTTAAMGSLYMDLFSIKSAVSEGLTLGEYTADFAAKESEWHHYNPNTNVFRQWAAVTSGNETYMQTTRTTYSYMSIPTELPGVYESPAFKLEAGHEVSATFDYSLSYDKADNFAEEEKDKTQLGLFLADKDVPSAFTTAVAVGKDASGERKTATGVVKIGKSGIYYFGFLADGPEKSIDGNGNITYNLYGLTLQDLTSGVSLVSDGSTVSYKFADNVLTIYGDYNAASIYGTNGVLVGSYSGVNQIDLNTLQRGIYILKVATERNVLTGKILVK